MPERIEVPDEFPAVGNVSGKRVVLTGAGRGLGELIAHALSRGGAKVALVARTARDLAEVAGALTGPTLQFTGDVRDPAFNDAVAGQTVEAWGGVDVWIGNAGISPVVAGPLETDPKVWREVIDVNLTGAFFGARAAARVMRPAGGSSSPARCSGKGRRRASPRTARPRLAWWGWPRRSPSTSPRSRSP